MPKQLKSTEPVVLLSKQTGVSVIPSNTLLTRLNYYDGKFLRAEDCKPSSDTCAVWCNCRTRRAAPASRTATT